MKMERRRFLAFSLTPLAIALVGKSVAVDKIIKNSVFDEAFLENTDMGTMTEAINRISAVDRGSGKTEMVHDKIWNQIVMDHKKSCSLRDYSDSM